MGLLFSYPGENFVFIVTDDIFQINLGSVLAILREQIGERRGERVYLFSKHKTLIWNTYMVLNYK